jgi:hypothetical protein
VLASTDTSFYVFDSTGKQIGSHAVNGLLPVKPGDYQLKLNNSAHPVVAQEKTLTKCSTGVQPLRNRRKLLYDFSRKESDPDYHGPGRTHGALHRRWPQEGQLVIALFLPFSFDTRIRF